MNPVNNAPVMTPEQMQAELARLQAENTKLKAQSFTTPNKLTLKVSEKGAISLYGLQRFPVTLYAESWEKVLNVAGDIRNFIETAKRQGQIKSKAEADAAKAAASTPVA